MEIGKCRQRGRGEGRVDVHRQEEAADPQLRPKRNDINTRDIERQGWKLADDELMEICQISRGDLPKQQPDRLWTFKSTRKSSQGRDQMGQDGRRDERNYGNRERQGRKTPNPTKLQKFLTFAMRGFGNSNHMLAVGGYGEDLIAIFKRCVGARWDSLIAAGIRVPITSRLLKDAADVDFGTINTGKEVDGAPRWKISRIAYRGTGALRTRHRQR